jgi:hypothetical protein
MKLFGFTLGKTKKKELKSFVQKTEEQPENAVVVNSANFSGSYFNFDNTFKTDSELINKYRYMSMNAEVELAIDDIVSESVITDDTSPVKMEVSDDSLLSDKLIKAIYTEFDVILKMLDFSNFGYDIFRSWYVDGRLYYHIIVDENKKKEGIQELRKIDPRKIKKIKEVKKNDQNIIESVIEYYVYNENGIDRDIDLKGIPIQLDAISYISSGIRDGTKNHTIGHLHKAIKPLNQLVMLENSAVIYRYTRAPERRVFYIDVGNLPKMKAEQYLSDVMNKYKNKVVYDGVTGEVKDGKNHMSMLEDYWFPRREGNSAQIDTLPGGTNLGEIDDIIYFQKKLYKSLNVPVSRLESENSMALGRATEINRDEMKFDRFIRRLRNRFDNLFYDLLKTQLILKNIISQEEWEDIKYELNVIYNENSYYNEIQDSEVLRDRVSMITDMDNIGLIGKYWSNEWIRKNILKMNDEEISQIDDEIKKELKVAQYNEPEEPDDKRF